jgi:hypothetical protein
MDFYIRSQTAGAYLEAARHFERMFEEHWRRGHPLFTDKVLVEAMRRANLQKLPAIKVRRALSREGLAEAKAWVDREICPVYRYAGPDGAKFPACSAGAGMQIFYAAPCDRFIKVGDGIYKPTTSVSVAEYYMPDRLMVLA